MNREKYSEELERTIALYKAHKKLFKKLELRVAKFGSHVPAYLEVEYDEVKEKMRLSQECGRLLLDGSNILDEIHKSIDFLTGFIESVKETMTLASTEKYLEYAELLQETAIEIAGLIVDIDRVNAEYTKITKEYEEL